MYAIIISAIVTAENFKLIDPTDNHPITSCFQDTDSFNSTIYRLCWKDNCSITNLFKACSNTKTCKPVVRICSENEHPAKQLNQIVLPAGIILLVLSFVASYGLQHFGNHYTFVKFFIQKGFIGTDSFVNAFIELWKSKEIFDKNIQNKLNELLKKAVLASEEGTVDNIFKLLKKPRKLRSS
jgi:hypothetical protein